MTIAYDNFTSSGAVAVNPSWTHTPTGTPRAAIVAFYYTTLDSIGVTYGGTAMTQVSVIDQTAGGELTSTRLGIWFLDNVASGNQIVAITGGTAQIKGGGCITVTSAGGAIQSEATNSIDTTASGVNPRVTVNSNGNSVFCCEVFTSGINSVGGITPPTSWTSHREDDNGTVTAGLYSYDTIGTSNVSAGVDQNNDDMFLLAATFSEVSAGGGPDTPQGLHGLDSGINVQRSSRLGGMLETMSGILVPSHLLRNDCENTIRCN